MSSDGEDLSDGDNSSESNMVWWEEEVEGEKVGLAFQAAAAPELVCLDSGCNRLILVDATGVDDYAAVLNSFLRTAQATARLQIAGRGRIGKIAVMIIPGATANLMSTNSIVINQCQITFGYDSDDEVYWCEITCEKGKKYGMEVKTIVARSFNDLWWITKEEMFDILLRGGFTVAEEEIHKILKELDVERR